MPDPIDELENFSTPGLTMTPLPASEVRRRGTRMRRRNTALATVGGIAAVAVIATPFAVIANHDGSGSEPQPARPTVWQQTIPEGFPLTDQMAGDPAVGARQGLRPIEACGSVAWSPTAPVASVERAGASYTDPESGESGQARTLALYEDDTAATRALADLRSAIADCPTDANGSGFDQELDLQPSRLGEESLAFSQRSVDESGDLIGEMTVVQATRVGNAILLSSATGAGGSSDEMVTGALVDLTTRTAGVVGAMCTFSAAGCGEPDTSTGEDSGSAAATVIPDGFDLLAGLPTDGATQDFGRVGPDRTLAPIDLEACDQPAPDTESLDLLRGGFTDPAYETQRQLMTFPDEATAQSYVDSLAALYPCTTDPSRGVVGEYRLADSSLGDSGVTAFLRYTVDGEPGMGHEIVHLVRVGQAVLLTRTVNDGDSTPITDAVRTELLAQSTSELTGVVDAMCVFADDGC